MTPRTPQWVEIDTDNSRYSNQQQQQRKGDTFNKACIVEGGRPPANISFYLGNEEITDPNVAGPTEVVVERENTTVTSRRISYKLRAEDDGKTITCRALHFAYPEGHADTPTNLRVNCKCV